MSDGFKPCPRCGSLYETLTTRGPACSKCGASKDYGDDSAVYGTSRVSDAAKALKKLQKHRGLTNARCSTTPMYDTDDTDDDSLTVTIDGKEWTPENDDTAEYDAIHAVAGAVLAGAENVEVTRGNDE